MRMVLLLGLLAIQGGCQKHELGDSKSVNPVTTWPADQLTDAQITSPNAIYVALKNIARESPPQDHNDPKSRERWAKYVDESRDKLLGKGDLILIAKCGADINNNGSILSYSESDKNIHVQTYNLTDEQAIRARKVYSNIIPLPAALLRNIISSSIYGHDDPVKLPYTSNDTGENPSIDQMINDMVDETTIPLIQDKSLGAFDGSIKGSAIDLQLDMADANLQQSIALGDEMNGRLPDGAKITAPLNRAIAKWRDFPNSFVPAGAKSNIPYAGDPAKVCLMLRVAEVDLADGTGRYVTPFISKKASLVGAIDGWYLVDRSSLSIIAHEKIMRSAE